MHNVTFTNISDGILIMMELWHRLSTQWDLQIDSVTSTETKTRLRETLDQQYEYYDRTFFRIFHAPMPTANTKTLRSNISGVLVVYADRLAAPEEHDIPGPASASSGSQQPDIIGTGGDTEMQRHVERFAGMIYRLHHSSLPITRLSESGAEGKLVMYADRLADPEEHDIPGPVPKQTTSRDPAQGV